MQPFNVIIKGFDWSVGKRILERTFDGYRVGFAISILNSRSDVPHLGAVEHQWLDAAALRRGEIDVDWNMLDPLDEVLIEEMRDTEAVAMEMISRFEQKRTIEYSERQRMYLRYLRYWSHVLVHREINLFLLSHVPHQVYDNVLYDLCKARGIPVLFLHPGSVRDTLYVHDDWKVSAGEIPRVLEQLRCEYAEVPPESIPLSPKFETCYQAQIQDRPDPPWYIDIQDSTASRRRVCRRWLKQAYDLLRRRPWHLLRQVVSPFFWQRKSRQWRTINLYHKLTDVFDPAQPYVFVPLHYQPEASTSPLGGVFTNQLLMVQLLAACLPDGIRIYIKENPYQKEVGREEHFYRDLHDIPSVRFMPKNLDSAVLIGQAIAVATVTGTAGFEAIFRGKPVLLFGHVSHQYAPGVFPIHSKADCIRAMDQILRHGVRPTRYDARIFLRAMEIVSIEGYFGRYYDAYTTLSVEQNIVNISDALRERLSVLP